MRKCWIFIIGLVLLTLACGVSAAPEATATSSGLNLPTLPPSKTDASLPTATVTETALPLRLSATSPPAKSLTPSETPTPMATKTPESESDTITENSKDMAVLIYIPAGEFIMGSEADLDPYFWGAEGPQHKVYLDAFWIYQMEVTNAMYADCVAAGGCNLPKRTISLTREQYYGNSQYSDYPVIHVQWYQARDYCQWAGGRLPSESEWEKAARGAGDARLFPWGDQSPEGNQANFCDRSCTNAAEKVSSANDGYADTAPVGSFPAGASPYGALDMSGNVWEWIADWHLAAYYGRSPYENPTGPDGGDRKGMRGGSWFNGPDGVRVVTRASRKMDGHFDSVGFRCVIDQP